LQPGQENRRNETLDDGNGGIRGPGVIHSKQIRERDFENFKGWLQTISGYVLLPLKLKIQTKSSREIRSGKWFIENREVRIFPREEKISPTSIPQLA
jgi:hypothetical protein